MSIITTDTDTMLPRMLMALSKERSKYSEGVKELIIRWNLASPPVNTVLVHREALHSIIRLQEQVTQRKLINEVNTIVDKIIGTSVANEKDLEKCYLELALTARVADPKIRLGKVIKYYKNYRFLIMVRLCELITLTPE